MFELMWADWALLGIILFSSLISILRGFTKEALSLVIWVIAFIVARSFQPQAQTLLSPHIADPVMLLAASFAILFIVTLLVGAVVSHLVSMLIKVTGLSTLDRVLGMVFGMARGVVVCIALVAIVRYTPWSKETWWSDSIVIEQLTVVEYWTRSVFGSGVDELSSFIANTKF